MEGAFRGACVKISAEQTGSIGRRFSRRLGKHLSENINCIGEVKDITARKCGSGKIKRSDKKLTEIKQNHACKDFLTDELRLF